MRRAFRLGWMLLILVWLPQGVFVLAEEPVRTWTTTDGETMEASWDRTDESNPDVIRLVSHGEKYDIDLKDLSDKDQQYIQQTRQKKGSKFRKVPTENEQPSRQPDSQPDSPTVPSENTPATPSETPADSPAAPPVEGQAGTPATPSAETPAETPATPSEATPEATPAGGKTAPPADDRKPGKRMVKRVDGIKYAFRWCPAGSFTMGSPEDEDGRKGWEGPQHEVTLTKGFWMLETEVTQEMWENVMGTKLLDQARKMLEDDTVYFIGESKIQRTLREIHDLERDETDQAIHAKGKKYPIYYVNWTECQEFCQRLSEKMGMTVKLPTEAQWEYACRAGTTTALYNGKIRILGLNKAPTLSRIAWYGGNSSQNFNFPSHWDSSKWEETQYPGGPCGAHAVGKKKANAWGLYDMIGNVSEWCEDRWFQKYPPGSVTDPTGPEHGTVRVHRGGGWDSNAGTCRSAHRACAVESCRFCCVGFRLIAIEPQKSE